MESSAAHHFLAIVAVYPGEEGVYDVQQQPLNLQENLMKRAFLPKLSLKKTSVH